jgi:Mg2+-importing ATPase
VTGDSPRTALVVCRALNIAVAETLSGEDIAAMSDVQLAEALDATTIFARVTPHQKSRIIELQRAKGADVGFLGDGVNDAVALHDADVGISVDSAAEVAKDAADIVLLKKDLGVLADGVSEGRRIFANTTKYVLMGTSSNFGNMFSAAGASLFLPFVPMLPSQILLNNLLYDISEMNIPTDHVDEEQLQRPAHWDMRFIYSGLCWYLGQFRRFSTFVTFGVMFFLFHAGSQLFRTGWFVESLATQSLVIFLIRTRRIPFFATPELAIGDDDSCHRCDRNTSIVKARRTGTRLCAAPFAVFRGPWLDDRYVPLTCRVRKGALLRSADPSFAGWIGFERFPLVPKRATF